MGLFFLTTFYLSILLPVLVVGAAQCQSLADSGKLEPPYSLDECYRMSLAVSERLSIQANEIGIAESRYQATVSALYPDLDLIGRQNFRNSSNFGRLSRSNSTSEDSSNPASTSGSLGRSQSEAALSLRQPIFHGFRDFLLARAARSEISAQESDLKRERELLFQDVASLYYQILYNLAQVSILEESQRTLKSRISELTDFVKLGKSRESEGLAAQAELEDLNASKERAEGATLASLELFSFLTGVPAKDLILSEVKSMPTLPSLDSQLAATAKRHDLQAASARVDENLSVFKASERERWPALDLTGNGYPLEDPDRNRAWELGIQLSLPIFDGGLISAHQSEARAQLEQAKLRSKLAQRAAERDVRTAFAQANANLAEFTSLKNLSETTRKNYELQKRDYGLGLVTNLDVLQAIRKVQDADIRLASAKFDYLNKLAALRVAVGGIQ